MRVLVCGGRKYDDREHVSNTLSELYATAGPFSVLIHGNARGADQLADDWAAGRVKTLTFAPQWEARGKAAGPLRNQKMIDEGKPDLVVAFPGNRGTEGMVARAMRRV